MNEAKLREEKVMKKLAEKEEIQPFLIRLDGEELPDEYAWDRS